MVELSILIPTIPPRLPNEFPSIYASLMKQLDGRKNVEVLGLCDNFVWSIGAKRNRLLSIASGSFICFVDDDDEVSGDYVDELLAAIKKPGVDHVSFETKIWAEQFINYESFEEKTESGYLNLESPHTHLHAWKKSFLQQEKFSDVSFAEDNDWATKLANKNPVTHHISKVLYFYRFDPLASEARNEAPA